MWRTYGDVLVTFAVGLPFAAVLVWACAGRSSPRCGECSRSAPSVRWSVETLQYALDIGRVSSVDDVLLNALGAAVAALLSRRWWARPESTMLNTVGAIGASRPAQTVRVTPTAG